MNKKTTIFDCSRCFFLLIAIVVFGNVQVKADSYTEDFSTTTGTYSSLTSLPDGWAVVGSISAFERETEKFHNAKPAIAIGSNTENYLVTPVVSGEVSFWMRNYTKNYSAKASVFACTPEGDSYNIGEQIGEQCSIAKGGTTWTKFTFNVTKPTRLAVLVSTAVFDDFYAESLGDDTPAEKRSLRITDFVLDSDANVMADENNEFSPVFSVKVVNSGNVELSAEEVSVSLTDGAYNVIATAVSNEPLAVNAETTLQLTATVSAAEGGSFYFYSKENLTNTFCTTGTGSNRSMLVNVTAYYAEFGIKGPEGWTLDSDETIQYGYSKTSVSRSFTVSNSGTAPLEVTSVSVPDGFTASETSFTVEPDAQKVISIILDADTEKYGAKSGTVRINHNSGTFSFNVSGTLVDPKLFFEDFEAQQLPDNWNAEAGWGIGSRGDNRYAQQNNNAEATSIVTPKLTVGEGDVLSFQAMRAFSYQAATLTVSYSDDGKEWTTVQEFEGITSAFQTATLRNLPEGNFYLRFTGQYVAIDNVLGFTLCTDQPVLSVSDGVGNVLSDDNTLDFGLQLADTPMTLTLANVGTGTLTATVGISDENSFSADKKEITLGAGESTTLTVTMLAQPYGEKSADVVITQDESAFTLHLSGQTRDPEILFVDFQDATWPRGWTTEGSWSITNESYSSAEFFAEHYDYTAKESEMTTSIMSFDEEHKLIFDASRSTESYASALKVYYSADRKTWTLAEDFTSQLSADMQTFTAENIPEGSWYVRFVAANVRIDNITGVRNGNMEHLVDLKTSIPASATVNWTYFVQAFVTNLWAESEEVTVKCYLNDKLVADITSTLGVNEDQDLSYGFTPHEISQDNTVYFEVTYAGQTLRSDVVTFSVLPESDETNAVMFSGTVVDDADGVTPVAGATLTLSGIYDDVIYTATTDENGQFSMKVWRGNLSYNVIVQKENYDEYSESIFFVADKTDYEVQMHSSVATGINVTGNSAVDGARVYNMQGQRVQKPVRGLYIVNGKKTFWDFKK